MILEAYYFLIHFSVTPERRFIQTYNQHVNKKCIFFVELYLYNTESQNF